jgi:hypothetical protein
MVLGMSSILAEDTKGSSVGMGLPERKCQRLIMVLTDSHLYHNSLYRFSTDPHHWGPILLGPGT